VSIFGHFVVITVTNRTFPRQDVSPKTASPTRRFPDRTFPDYCFFSGSTSLRNKSKSEYFIMQMIGGRANQRYFTGIINSMVTIYHK